MSTFRLRLSSERLGFDSSSVVSTPVLLWKNFHLCPHCRKQGRPALVETLDKDGPIITRSDGETFHLILGDKPISFPAERPKESEVMTAGFWYVHEANGEFTQTVVVLLRRPRRRGVSLVHHLEMIADRLAEKLKNPRHFATLYEFYGNRLRRVS